MFGSDQPVAVEIGPGRGEFLLVIAPSNPRQNYFAIERSRSHAQTIQEKLEARNITNARILHADATCVLEMLPDACVVAFYVQFPDPWWKRRHEQRRLWTRRFVAAIRRTLVPGGIVELVTDVVDTFALAQRRLDEDACLEPISVHRPPELRTSFARKARMRDAPLYHSIHRKKQTNNKD